MHVELTSLCMLQWRNHCVYVCTYTVRTYAHIHFIPVWMTMADVVSFCWRTHCWYRRFAIQLLTPVTMAAGGGRGTRCCQLRIHNHIYSHTCYWVADVSMWWIFGYVRTYACMPPTHTWGHMSDKTLRMWYLVTYCEKGVIFNWVEALAEFQPCCEAPVRELLLTHAWNSWEPLAFTHCCTYIRTYLFEWW